MIQYTSYKEKGVRNKFDQISEIFSQFSEKNKDKLLETANSLLKVQKEGLAFSEAQYDDKKGNCPGKETK